MSESLLFVGLGGGGFKQNWPHSLEKPGGAKVVSSGETERVGLRTRECRIPGEKQGLGGRESWKPEKGNERAGGRTNSEEMVNSPTPPRSGGETPRNGRPGAGYKRHQAAPPDGRDLRRREGGQRTSSQCRGGGGEEMRKKTNRP